MIAAVVALVVLVVVLIVALAAAVSSVAALVAAHHGSTRELLDRWQVERQSTADDHQTLITGLTGRHETTLAKIMANAQAEARQREAERDTLLRAAMSRGPGDFAALERIQNQRLAATQPFDRKMTAEEYAQWLAADFERVAGGVGGDVEYLLPEGLA